MNVLWAWTYYVLTSAKRINELFFKQQYKVTAAQVMFFFFISLHILRRYNLWPLKPFGPPSQLSNWSPKVHKWGYQLPDLAVKYAKSIIGENVFEEPAWGWLGLQEVVQDSGGRWNDQMHFWDTVIAGVPRFELHNNWKVVSSQRFSRQGTQMLDAGAGTGLLSHCLKETLRPHGKRMEALWETFRWWQAPLLQFELQRETSTTKHTKHNTMKPSQDISNECEMQSGLWAWRMQVSRRLLPLTSAQRCFPKQCDLASTPVARQAIKRNEFLHDLLWYLSLLQT